MHMCSVHMCNVLMCNVHMCSVLCLGLGRILHQFLSDMEFIMSSNYEYYFDVVILYSLPSKI